MVSNGAFNFCHHMVLLSRGFRIQVKAMDSANSAHMFGPWLGVGMSMYLHACIWVVYCTLSPCSWTHDTSSSLADTICILMKWNLVPSSVLDSWQFRPGQHGAKIAARQTDYLYHGLLLSSSHDSIQEITITEFKVWAYSGLGMQYVCITLFIIFGDFYTLKSKCNTTFKFNMNLTFYVFH